MCIPILPSAAGSLPASSPYRKGAERRFEEEADLLADRLAVGLFGVASVAAADSPSAPVGSRFRAGLQVFTAGFEMDMEQLQPTD
ncbi:MAG: hypothetical protein OXG71_09225 [Rhodospirillales bacterium]|nr:hypothetical protein [Rhodospirillales bacterium]MYJ08718.1 hypothetical protein [Gemmatimonadota bacterium]